MKRESAVIELFCPRHQLKERFRIRVLGTAGGAAYADVEPRLDHVGRLVGVSAGTWLKDREQKIKEFLREYFSREGTDIKVELLRP